MRSRPWKPLLYWRRLFEYHATIEESIIYPTAEQALTCLRVCH
ncbi:MAG TPA: hypothetical protein V6D33_05200 [Cyanophyceae cyanobacterium]